MRMLVGLGFLLILVIVLGLVFWVISDMEDRKHRDALRMAGLHPVQIWVPDTRHPGFAEECRRQSLLAAQADSADTSMQQFMGEALADVDGWAD